MDDKYVNPVPFSLEALQAETRRRLDLFRTGEKVEGFDFYLSDWNRKWTKKPEPR